MKLNADAECCVKTYLHWLVKHKPRNFANGREMRNLFELALSNQANRLAEKADISDEELNEIVMDDLPLWVICPQNIVEQYRQLQATRNLWRDKNSSKNL